jgi:hypothetical protein
VVTALWEDIFMMIAEWTKDEDDPRDRHRSASLDDDDRSRSEYYSHCATTAPLTDDIAIPTNTLDASSLVDATPESANKDSKNNIAGPDPDSEHSFHEFAMDIDDSDEGQTRSTHGQVAFPAVYLKRGPRLLKPTITKKACISFLITNRLLSASLKIGTSFRRVLSRTTC